MKSRFTQPQPRPVLKFSRPLEASVLVAGNNQRFVEGISELLKGRESLRVVGTALDRTGAAERLVLLRPDVIVIDINLDYELGGIDTSFALRRISPATSFVLVSPYRDPERLSMVPRGLGLEWSYILTATAENGNELARAIRGAAWSIPYIDPAVDRTRLGAIHTDVDRAIEEVLRPVREKKRPQKESAFEWHGTVQRFHLSDDEPEAGA